MANYQCVLCDNTVIDEYIIAVALYGNTDVRLNSVNSKIHKLSYLI